MSRLKASREYYGGAPAVSRRPAGRGGERKKGGGSACGGAGPAWGRWRWCRLDPSQGIFAPTWLRPPPRTRLYLCPCSFLAPPRHASAPFRPASPGNSAEMTVVGASRMSCTALVYVTHNNGVGCACAKLFEYCPGAATSTKLSIRDCRRFNHYELKTDSRHLSSDG